MKKRVWKKLNFWTLNKINYKRNKLMMKFNLLHQKLNHRIKMKKYKTKTQNS